MGDENRNVGSNRSRRARSPCQPSEAPTFDVGDHRVVPLDHACHPGRLPRVGNHKARNVLARAPVLIHRAEGYVHRLDLRVRHQLINGEEREAPRKPGGSETRMMVFLERSLLAADKRRPVDDRPLR